MKSKLLLAAFIALVAPRLNAAPLTCDPGNGGLKLPAGFCAILAADGLGVARHLVVAPNGDVYVSLRDQGNTDPGGIVALRDANGDGKFEIKERFGKGSSTGIALHNGYLYVATITSVERYKMSPGQLTPAAPAEIVVANLPIAGNSHRDKGIAFDGKGSLYINMGAPSNACQMPDRRPGVAGQDPCPLLDKFGGIWKFDENKLGQKHEDGTRYATGMRQMLALAWHDNALYIAMNNRDALDTLWPDRFTLKDNVERPAEPLYRAAQAGMNFGWPYCFYDYGQKKLLLNPEYGGDGKIAGRCDQYAPPIASYPAHWAPLDLMFYTGNQLPARYRNGAFLVFHGSWNRAPSPQDGYNVTFQPFANGQPSGPSEIFADGFAGRAPLMNPTDAAARANGIAQAPDGSLFIADSQKGKVWHVIYRGGGAN